MYSYFIYKSFIIVTLSKTKNINLCLKKKDFDMQLLDYQDTNNVKM
jgi:hypothetical protein